MNTTAHAARRSVERDISAFEIILARDKPQRIWRTGNKVIRRRKDVVIVTDATDKTLITAYRWDKNRAPELN